MHNRQLVKKGPEENHNVPIKMWCSFCFVIFEFNVFFCLDHTLCRLQQDKRNVFEKIEHIPSKFFCDMFSTRGTSASVKHYKSRKHKSAIPSVCLSMSSMCAKCTVSGHPGRYYLLRFHSAGYITFWVTRHGLWFSLPVSPSVQNVYEHKLASASIPSVPRMKVSPDSIAGTKSF